MEGEEAGEEASVEHVRRHIVLLQKSIRPLQQMIDMIGTQNDSEGLRSGMNHVGQTLRKRITTAEVALAALDRRLPGVKKLGKDLRSQKCVIIEMLEQADRVTKTHHRSWDSSSSLMSNDEDAATVGGRRRGRGRGSEGGDAGALDDEDSSGVDGKEISVSLQGFCKDGEFMSRDDIQRRLQEQAVIEGEIEVNEQLIKERREAMADINRQLHEVGLIFKDLAVLVSDADEGIQEIESNVTKANDAARAACHELQVADERQRQSRCIMT